MPCFPVVSNKSLHLQLLNDWNESFSKCKTLNCKKEKTHAENIYPGDGDARISHS